MTEPYKSASFPETGDLVLGARGLYKNMLAFPVDCRAAVAEGRLHRG